MYLLLYAAGWILTAVLLAWSNRDAAPTDPDPVGVGMIFGAVWPVVWAAWLVTFVVTALAVLLARLTGRIERRQASSGGEG